MKVMILGLYGLDYTKAWYRKDGNCFDFVNDEKFASNLSIGEVAHILKYKEWYLKQYAANRLVVTD